MTRFFKFILAGAAAASFVACGTSKKVESSSTATAAYERLDWQGRATGSEIPSWVQAAGDNSKKQVMKALNLDENKEMVWIFNVNGSDLEFLEHWTDKVELQSNVAQSISASIGRATEAALEAEQSVSSTAKDKTLKDVTTVLSNVRVYGLEKEASYWIKSRAPKVLKPASDEDYEVKYTYFSVYTMKKELYEKQVQAAMNGLQSSTRDDKILMTLITNSITKTMLGDSAENVFTFDAE